jgi:hypothetical protein
VPAGQQEQQLGSCGTHWVASRYPYGCQRRKLRQGLQHVKMTQPPTLGYGSIVMAGLPQMRCVHDYLDFSTVLLWPLPVFLNTVGLTWSDLSSAMKGILSR